MKFRVLSMALSLSALIFAMGSWAQESPKVREAKANDPSAEIREETAVQEKILLRQFKEFQEQTLKLMQILKASPFKEKKERAEQLRRVLEISQDSSITIRFERIADFLKKDKLSLTDMKRAADDTRELADKLEELVNLLQTDTQSQRAKDKENTIKQALKELEQIIRDQKQIQAQTDRQQTDKNELENGQNKVAQATKKLGNTLDKLDKLDKGIDPKDIKSGEAKNDKSEPKDGGKDGGKQSGEAKDEGKKTESKKGETKDNGAKSDPKGGEPKGNKDGKPAEAKGGEPKEAKTGEPKDAPPSEAKSGKSGTDSKQADAKSGKSGKDAQGSPKDSKGGEAKQGEQKDAGKGEPKEKTADAKGGAKTKQNPDGEKKPAEAKTGKGNEDKQAGAKDKGDKSPDGKQAQSKDGGKDNPKSEAKSGDKSEGKSSAKAKSSPGSPMPPQDQQPQAKSGEPKDQQSPPPSASNPKDDQIGKKQVQDAEYKQKQAAKEIADGKNKDASDKQSQALKDLQEAKKKLEERLKIAREEELERILAALLVRCEKMLAMQVEVLNGTERLQKAIQTNATKKPERENQIESGRLSDDEKKIVIEATRAIEILEAEGSAVAFPEVFQQVREDMKHVQRRLDVTDAGVVTQGIERDIIASLTEMIDALKKKQDDMKDQKNPPKPGDPKAQQPQDQKLLDQIAELKMIRSMQVRLNDRTQIYGKQYQGEQAFEPSIRREIEGLAGRQERIFDITNRIAKGDNK